MFDVRVFETRKVFDILEGKVNRRVASRTGIDAFPRSRNNAMSWTGALNLLRPLHYIYYPLY